MTTDEKWKARARELVGATCDSDTCPMDNPNECKCVNRAAAALAEAAAEERERAAALAENYEHVNAGVNEYDNHYWEGASDAGQDIAAAIRAREQKP